MTKTKKKLKKGWSYLKRFDELKENIHKGNLRVYIDNNYEICDLQINKNLVYFCCEYIPNDLEELFSNCEIDDYFEVSIAYETTYENFCNIFTKLIESKRLTYPKRQ